MGTNTAEAIVAAARRAIAERGSGKLSLSAVAARAGADDANAFGETAWAAGMLFHQAVDNIVARDGVNGITRAKFLAELAKTGDFDAGGMLATTNIGARLPSACYALVQVQKNKFVRVHPKKPGTFDCDRKNIAVVKLSD